MNRAPGERGAQEHRIRIWTGGGHIITGGVDDVDRAEDLEAELEKLGRHVSVPVARAGLIEIPQGDGSVIQVVLEQIEAWSIEPERRHEA